MTPHEATFGEHGDIYNICNFGWYRWVYYRTTNSFPAAKECLGRVLVPINNEGSEISQAVLTSKAKIVPWRSIRLLNTSENNSETEQRKREIFHNIIKDKLGDAMTKPNKPSPYSFIPYYDGDLDPPALHEVDEDPDQTNGTVVFEHPITNQCIHTELNLHRGEEMKKAKLVGRYKDNYVNIIDKYDSNPMLNTMVYDVDFPDGTIHKYRANLIDDNMYYQVYSEIFLHPTLSGILDSDKDTTTAKKGDQYIITKSIQRCMRKSTIG